MSEPGVERARRHVMSLKSAIPSKAWLSRARSQPDRAGPAPVKALGELSGIVTKTLLARVQVALGCLPSS
ncbi:hypothetical protein GCM10010112_63350 [Actinoplanes lobatus]|uniref:Uncharacterized protein n=1 Tax=Actinoplanes lobatus TaxID=113568 RepID=A0A7W7MJ21_9ACTN|nr:hypothetical protein [Actinoplanes lobatus]MBB4752119.1 hypothetical protein [Actinoplanes lobatus]GGN84210.1 hypothetical protein GCM10010112_63350 [Actinoplanes lobatus]GIE44112.1 hypothetical protein Alo02nite_70100 [Actinoplanes lobatus]